MAEVKQKKAGKGAGGPDQVTITFKNTKGERIELKVPKGTRLKEFLGKRGYIHQKGITVKVNDKLIRFNEKGELIDDVELTENAVLTLTETFTGGVQL